MSEKESPPADLGEFPAPKLRWFCYFDAEADARAEAGVIGPEDMEMVVFDDDGAAAERWGVIRTEPGAEQEQ
jgi:hypothetical protein